MQRKYQVDCRWCDQRFNSGEFSQSFLFFYFKNYYMWRKVVYQLYSHCFSEHKTQWPKYQWQKYIFNGIKGYSIAILKDLLHSPFKIIKLIWHYITIAFVKIDNSFYSSWF